MPSCVYRGTYFYMMIVLEEVGLVRPVLNLIIECSIRSCPANDTESVPAVYHLRRQELCDGICKANKVGQQANRSNLYITPAIP
ncbi:hypothetical protein J6590_098184 [Homalodisca vitripennis]|nr:hypothetical protein J6590_098184 [Homalodisca vitripennis]